MSEKLRLESDIVLIGAGIMSATLATMLQKMDSSNGRLCIR